MNQEAVLNFWFEELKPEQWFKKDPDLDQEIKTRFQNTYDQAVAGELENWRQTPEGRLAEIIVLDQFARNIFRNSAQAFAHDPLALALAQEAVRHQYDDQLPDQQKVFLYMPFMHSESPLVHQQALILFKKAGQETNLEYEKKHKEIIDRFGRYPHRNQILGRESTAEELEFLKTNPGF